MDAKRDFAKRKALSALVWGLLALMFSSSAIACKFIIDKRSEEERLKDAPVVFIGVVEKADFGRETVWLVEKGIKGAKDGDRLALPSRGTSCDIRFQTGERWLFAGAGVMNPSRKMPSARQGGASDGGKHKEPENKGASAQSLPWRICSEQSPVCELARYGCDGLMPVAQAKKQEAEKELWMKFGAPKTLNCVGGSESRKSLVAVCQMQWGGLKRNGQEQASALGLCVLREKK